MTVQHLTMLADWSKLCSDVCSKDALNKPMSVEERECYRTCGINMSTSYVNALVRFAKENGYKRY